MSGYANRWTDSQRETLVQMRAAKKPWPEIVRATGHPANSCQIELSKMRARKRQAEFLAERGRIDTEEVRKRKQWLEDDVNQLLFMKADKIDNARIATHFAVSKHAIQQIIHRLKKEGVRVGFECLPEKPAGRPKKYDLGPLKVVNANPPYSRTNTSTAKLQLDAELRARIAVIGITGGLQGDPLPGRSALDKHRAGITDPPSPVRERFNQIAAPVTLPTGPLR